LFSPILLKCGLLPEVQVMVRCCTPVLSSFATVRA
jgi:hypothetical protein